MPNKTRLKLNILRTLPYVAIGAAVVLIWLQFLLYKNGFISFGNSVYPLDHTEILGLLKEYSIFGYNQYAYGGSILPGTNTFPNFVENFINSIYLVSLNSFMTAEISLKIFIVSLNLFMAFSFLFLLNTITKRKIVAVLATLFIVLNPFQIQLIAYGDTGQMEQMGFLFFSLYFAISFVRSDSGRYINIVLSAIFLILVYPFYQAFILGGVLVAAIMLLKFRTILKGKFSRNQLKSLAVMILVIPSILYILWPFLFGGNNLSPTSAFAQTFSNFVYYSEPFWKVLLLQGYSPFVSSIYLVQLTGKAFAGIWIILFDFFLIILLTVVPIISRKYPSLLITLAIVVFALVGSGAKSPIAPINEFFYINLPGYQTLNTSYYWDWILISPLYSIQLAIGLDWLFNHFRNGSKSRFSMNKSPIKGAKKITVIVIILALLFVSFEPFISQGYYGNGYIQTVNLPNDYSSIPNNINNISGNNYTGVAFLNPDNLLYLGNSSNNGFNSPFFNMMPTKTFGLPNYAAPPFSSSYYLYWVYSMFYRNQTTELGNLMAVLGIQYFVVLYKSNSLSSNAQFMPWSKNVNASELMKYQTGVQRICRSTNYSIYKNLFYGGQTSSVSSLSIVLGNFTSMSAMAASGVNLSTFAPIFYPELRNINIEEILPFLSSVIYNRGQIYSLIYADQNESELNILNSVTNSNDNVNTQWINSQKLIGGGHASPSIVSGIVTNGNNTVNFEVKANTSGPHSIWIRALNSSNGGYINITGNNSFSQLDTKVSGNETNSSYIYKWYKVVMNLHKGKNEISITSSDDYNSISAIFYGEEGQFSSFLNNTLNKLHGRGISIVSMRNLTNLRFNNSVQPSNLRLTFDGFSVSSAEGLAIIRNSYFSTFTPMNSNVRLIPIYDGLNFVVISHKPTQILYYPISFYTMSLIIPSLFISLSTLLAFIWRKKQ